MPQNPTPSIRRRAVAILAFAVTLALAVPARGGEQGATAASLIKYLRAPNWWTVHCSAIDLESQQAKAIPALLELTESREVVPLINTMDLIYPGAKTFYGHGYIVNYALDSLAVRAGWVLETITFQDFGFRSGTIQEDALFAAMRERPGDMPLEEAVGPQKTPGPGPIAAAAARARQWWARHGRHWSRYQAVVEALDSKDPRRQADILIWLRGGLSDCDGLEAKFDREIRPRIAKLTSSPDPTVSQQAGYLLKEGLWSEKRMNKVIEELDEKVESGLNCKNWRAELEAG